jgi:DNA-binding transcriptional LysR family regulator
MELRELTYYLAVVREENISRAAEVLHVTQPTLSRQMAQLEEELGVQLFVRGRQLVLTDAGIMLRRRAEEVVTLVDKIETEFEELSEVAGNIAIGMGGLQASNSLIAAVIAFKQKYPMVNFSFYTNSAEYVKERLDQGLLDFGLLLEPVDVAKYDYIRMKEKEKWGLLIKNDSPLAVKKSITREDLFSCPIVTSYRAPIQRELEVWLGVELTQLDILATFNIITNVTTFVSSGAAAALTIEGAVNLFEGGTMTFRPLEPEMAMTSVLAWKKLQPNFGAVGKFLEFFKSMQKMDGNL